VTRALTLAFALTLSSIAFVAGPVQAQTSETRSISVEGSSSQLISNDTARFTASVTVRRKTANRALVAAGRATRRVLASLAELGIARADTRTTSISVRRVFARDPRTGRLRVVGYRARSSVRTIVRDLSELGSAIDGVIDAGATDVGSVTFYVFDSDAVYLEVLAEAFDEARAKAELLAERAGLTLGAARVISEGRDEDFFTASLESAAGGAPTQDAAPPPIRPGRSRIEAIVSVVFDATAP
jgi:uncharacterized protein YggE